jgi:hypothetical protein
MLPTDSSAEKDPRHPSLHRNAGQRMTTANAGYGEPLALSHYSPPYSMIMNDQHKSEGYDCRMAKIARRRGHAHDLS